MTFNFDTLTNSGANPESNSGFSSYIPVIAEIGINHNGDLELAKKMIDLAVSSGCDAVKFQKRTIEIVYTAEVLDTPRESPWGTTQREQKNGLEFDLKAYQEIDTYCKEKGIQWSASAWDLPSLEFVENFSPPFHKVASALITHMEFLNAVAKLKRLTFVSTGMADEKMVKDAVAIFKKHGTPVVLLHTVSTYPSPEEDLNLRAMETLRNTFGLPVGYSGHETSVSPSIVAASLGAVAIERHITVDRTMYGSDQAASLEEAGLRNLVAVVRKIPKMMGSGKIEWAPGEEAVAKKLRYWEN
jgi:N-acetylneuraminate synthase